VEWTSNAQNACCYSFQRYSLTHVVSVVNHLPLSLPPYKRGLRWTVTPWRRSLGPALARPLYLELSAGPSPLISTKMIFRPMFRQSNSQDGATQPTMLKLEVSVNENVKIVLADRTVPHLVRSRLSSVTYAAKRCVLEQKLLLTAYRIIGTKINDLDLCFRSRLRSCQTLRYIRHWISRKSLEIEAWFERTTNRKWHMGYEMVTWPIYITSRDPETRYPNTLRTQYLENSWRCYLHVATIANY